MNHRFGLYDAILIKENHITSAGGVEAAVRTAKEQHTDLPIEIEDESITEFKEALRAGADRLLLDNFDHIKAYWIQIGPRLAQIALRFGADDLDGTIIEETITHAAGASTAQGMTHQEIERIIRAAGREPVERDTLYRPVVRDRSGVALVQ